MTTWCPVPFSTMISIPNIAKFWLGRKEIKDFHNKLRHPQHREKSLQMPDQYYALVFSILIGWEEYIFQVTPCRWHISQASWLVSDQNNPHTTKSNARLEWDKRNMRHKRNLRFCWLKTHRGTCPLVQWWLFILSFWNFSWQYFDLGRFQCWSRTLPILVATFAQVSKQDLHLV